MSRFAGKTALVTGAAGRIGAAIVLQLRAEGAHAAVARSNLSQTRTGLIAIGSMAVAVKTAA